VLKKVFKILFTTILITTVSCFATNKKAERYYQQGIKLHNLGKYRSAISSFSQAIKIDPNSWSAYRERAGSYFMLGNSEKGTEDLQKSIQLKLASKTAQFEREELKILSKKIDEPLSNRYYEAIENYNIGSTYAMKEDYLTAIKYFSHSVRLNPNFMEAYLSRGITLITIGEYELAVTDLTKAISLNSKHGKAYYNRGVAYTELGQYSSAIKDYTKAYHNGVRDDSLYFNRGLSYLRLGMYEPAILDYTEAIALNPNFVEAYNNRAVAYKRAGNITFAMEDYRKAEYLRRQKREASSMASSWNSSSWGSSW
jgi:tetratricopeptide (TPR) repeat protein